MFAFPIRTAALTAAAAIGLSACTTPYGYGGVSVGYGSNYYDPYYGYGYGSGYPRYGHGYGFDPYWGWNDGFYYPGSGFYVYDSYRRPFRWTDAQRRYWTIRREQALTTSTTSQPVVIRDNWRDFDRQRVKVRQNRVERSIERPVRIERSSRPLRVERSSIRSEAKEKAVVRTERRSSTTSEKATRSNGRHRGHTQVQQD